ncbi:MAG: KH domain-containing protein [Deinococcus sp.]|nr:KH domain-containing protein [Deinococcus sp.]
MSKTLDEVERALGELGITADEDEDLTLPEPSLSNLMRQSRRSPEEPEEETPAGPALRGPVPDHPLANKIKEILEETLPWIGRYTYQMTMQDDTLLVDIKGRDLGAIIGKNGQTIKSLELILNVIASRAVGENSRVILDAGNYRSRQDHKLEQMAQRMAEKARLTGHPVELEPMDASSRRIIHLALKDDATVHTESTGIGSNRRVVIYPR